MLLRGAPSGASLFYCPAGVYFSSVVRRNLPAHCAFLMHNIRMKSDDDTKVTFRITLGTKAINGLTWLAESLGLEQGRVVRVAFSWLHYTIRVLNEGGVVWIMQDGDVREIKLDDLQSRGIDKPDEDS